MMELIFKVMKAFSLYYVSWKIVPFRNLTILIKEEYNYICNNQVLRF